MAWANLPNRSTTAVESPPEIAIWPRSVPRPCYRHEPGNWLSPNLSVKDWTLFPFLSMT